MPNCPFTISRADCKKHSGCRSGLLDVDIVHQDASQVSSNGCKLNAKTKLPNGWVLGAIPCVVGVLWRLDSVEQCKGPSVNLTPMSTVGTTLTKPKR